MDPKRVRSTPGDGCHSCSCTWCVFKARPGGETVFVAGQAQTSICHASVQACVSAALERFLWPLRAAYSLANCPGLQRELTKPGLRQLPSRTGKPMLQAELLFTRPYAA